MPKTLLLLVLGGAAALAAAVPSAFSTAPPIGPLPAGPTTSVRVAAGGFFTATLPRPQIAGGTWRIARSFDSTVLHQSSERTTAAGAVAVAFRAVAPGSTRVVFALTRGEKAKAYAARLPSWSRAPPRAVRATCSHWERTRLVPRSRPRLRAIRRGTGRR